MALDDRLNQLQVLKVGNVEKAIGEISDSQFESETIQDNTNIELELYQKTIEEKLPKIIENICLLKDQIVDLKNVFKSFYPIKVGNNQIRMEISKKSSKKGSILTVYDYIDYAVRFDFETNSNFPKEISFFTYESKKRHSKQDYIPRLKADTIPEFVDKIKIFLVNQIEKRGNYYNSKLEDRDYSSLPHFLNLVPELLSRIYKEKSNTHKNKLEVTQHQNQSLEDLDVSDFS